MFGLSKKKLTLLVLLAAVVGILFSLISYKIQNSTDWQQRKMARTVAKQEAEFYRNEAALNALAKQILDTTLQESSEADARPECVIWLDDAQDRAHPVYGDQLNAYIEDNRTVFERVEVNSACYHTCPAESCIFRTTQYYLLNHQRNVYCWINLVYNENWQEILDSEEYRRCVELGLVKVLAPNWCIVIEYGY